MHLPLETQPNIITHENKQAILASYKEMMIDYMDLTVSEERFYFTHDMVGMSLERFVALMGDLFLLNQSIIKKTVFHLMTHEPEALSSLGFTPVMQDVVRYTFDQMQCERREDLILSYYGRYDLIIDKQGRPQIVELNSETPAGYPESVTTNIIFDHVPLQNLIDVNQDFEKNLEKSLHHKLEAMREIGPTTMCVMFLDDSRDGGIGEDRTNAMYITEFFARQLPACTVVMSNVTDCEMRIDGVYYNGIKQVYIYSFYPLERYFTDAGSTLFWSAYMAGEFDLINHPLNLITQSKAFWAYLYDCVDRQEKKGDLTLFTSAELMMIHDMISRYYFVKPSFFSFVPTINKPLFFREGVGIGDPSYIGQQVYQTKVDQQSFTLQTFEGPKTGYITLGIYHGEAGYIGMYARFCTSAITDSSAYFVPVYTY